jgi:hypothetical protein
VGLVTERPASEVRAAQLSGSHIGRTATLGFGTDRHPGGLIRGRLDTVRHGVDGDDVEIGLVVGGQRLSIDVSKDKVVELD